MAFRAVIAGGGVAGIEAALALHALAPDLVSVELVSPEPEFAYRPLAVSEPFGHGHVHMLDLRTVAGDIGAELRIAGLAGVDDAASKALFDDGSEAEYDALVIACGTRLVPAVPGADTFAGPRDVEMFRRLLDDVDAGQVGSLAFVVPHGVVWPLPIYELALDRSATREAHRGAGRRHVRGGAARHPRPGGRGRLGSSRSTASRCRRASSRWRCVTAPHARTGRGCQGRQVRGAPGAARHRALGCPTRFGGFIRVDEHGRVDGLDNVFAAGDITTYRPSRGGSPPAGRRRRRSSPPRPEPPSFPSRSGPSSEACSSPATARGTSRPACAARRRSRPLRRLSPSGHPRTRSPRRFSRPTSRDGSRARCDSAPPARATRRSHRTSGSASPRAAR